MLIRNLKQSYSPLYFLAALGPGGLAVSFFMYLMFLVPHKGTPMAAMAHWMPIVEQGGLKAVLVVAVLAIVLILAALHFVLLKWNFREWAEFKKGDGYKTLKSGNAEVTIMAMPLAVSMSINMMFILGSLFVPNLWSFIQPVFPVATLAFVSVGIWALTIYGKYLMRLVQKGNFNEEMNNNFGQLLAPFTFSMIAVGLAAPGAMSHSLAVSGISLALSATFAILTVVLSIIWLILGFKQIIKQGLDVNGSPTLWILIPILTLLGITFVRYTMGLHHNFGSSLENSLFLAVMSIILGLQLLVGVFGYFAMKGNQYFTDFLQGDKKSPASFGLICPGVALVVFSFFFINYALISNGIVEKYSLVHMLTLLPVLMLQLKTTAVMLKMIAKQLIQPKAALQATKQ
jgi:hypothetical protein